MFEQSVLPTPHANRPWTFFAASAAELLALAAAIIVPLFYIPPLRVAKTPDILRLIRSMNVVKLVPAVPDAQRATPPVHPFTAPRPFHAPARVPTRIASVSDTVPFLTAPIIGLPPGMAGSDITGINPLPNGAVPPPPGASPRQKPAGEPIRVSSGVQEAKLIHKVMPLYPRFAIETHQSGAVRLVATIGKDGRVKQIQVLSGPAFLARAAVEAVQRWIYKPTLLNGAPVEVIAPIDVNFVLSR
ncbi:MAG TPA: energy transducer TonB [Bryobacteraceae bacterium]|nr:energy transducer TonB [Bryobacteraceae bacterium]